MGLPPLSGCLWDNPPQLGKNSLMIVVGEMGERRSPSTKLHVFALVSCVILFSKGGHIQVTWWSLICYINTDLHSPQSARINFIQRIHEDKTLVMTLVAAKESCRDVHSSSLHHCKAANPPSSQ